MGVIDAIVSEPKGGAQRNWNEAFALMKEALDTHWNPLLKKAVKSSFKNSKKLIDERIAKFRELGNFAITELKPRKNEGSSS